jgi:hypothetical protein
MQSPTNQSQRPRRRIILFSHTHEACDKIATREKPTKEATPMRHCAQVWFAGRFVKAKLTLKSSSPTTGHLAKADAVVVVEHTH